MTIRCPLRRLSLHRGVVAGLVPPQYAGPAALSFAAQEIHD
jgi:hypothetical protein